MLVTPWAGTVNVSSLPEEEYVHVFATLASPLPQTGSTADALPASPSATATVAPSSTSPVTALQRRVPLRADPSFRRSAVAPYSNSLAEYLPLLQAAQGG